MNRPASKLAQLGLLIALMIFGNDSFAENPSGVGTQAADEAARKFSLPDGLEVSVFASEPMVRNPTDMDIDERGRVWITEAVNYRSTIKEWGTLDKAGDRIICLEDTNSDGRADKETVFYQDPSINAALGICVLGNKVIVSVSPNVFVLTDTDQDGVADKRELLFTGIKGRDHDHGTHAFVFGPDGKLYFNIGNAGRQLFRPTNTNIPLHGVVDGIDMKPVVDLAGNEVTDRGNPYRMGMVFRCNMDGSDVETLAWNFRNNYEIAVDSFGALWQSDNDDDGNRGVRINYVMEFGNYGYADEVTGAAWRIGWQKAQGLGVPEENKINYEWHQQDPGVVPNLLHTGAGSPTGITVYEGELLPEKFRNQLIHCDAGPGVVRAYPAQAAGAGFKADIVNLATSSDSWFRPSDACVAPDGSVFIADWNDAGVGGHNMADSKPARMTGRVYRIAPRGNKLTVPKTDLKTAAGCVEALQSPNLSQRYLAWMKLHQMGRGAEKSLLTVWNGNAPRMRARALQLLARIPQRSDHYIAESLKDPDADIRITGLRIARALKLDLIPLVEKLSHDNSPQVRRECSISLRHNKSPKAAALWSTLASQYDGSDRWYLEALGIGADDQWDRFLESWLTKTPNALETQVGRDIIWRSRSRMTPGLIFKLLSREPLPALERERFLRTLDFCPEADSQAVLIQLATQTDPRLAALVPAALTRLNKLNLTDHPAVKAALLRTLDQVKGKPDFVEMIRAFNLSGMQDILLEMAASEPGQASGVDAMRLLLESRNETLIRNALAGTNGSKIAEALGNTGSKQIPPLLQPIVSDSAIDRVVRIQAVRSLSKSRQGAEALLKLAEDQRLPEDLKLTTGLELNSVRQNDLRLRAAKILPLAQSRDARPLPAISELIKRNGDVARGAAVYRSDAIGCIKCHQLNGEGIDFGPNLSEIGAKLGKDALYESVLDPSAGISFGYEAWQVEFKNGDEAFGLIVNETETELSIKAVGGIVTRFKKADIATRAKQKLSSMPTNLTQAMTDQEFVDLVEYLSTLKKAVK